MKVIRVWLALIVAGVWLSPLNAMPPEPDPAAHLGSVLTLEEVVARATKDHAEVKRAAAKLSKEEALYKAARADFLPEFKMAMFSGAATGERSLLTSFDTGIEQPLFRGGKTLAQKRRQKTVVDREGLKVQESKLDVELMVRVLYAQALERKELTRIAGSQVKELAGNYERIKKLTDQDILPLHELYRFETLLESSKYALAKHQEDYAYLGAVLRQISGIPEGEPLELEPLGERMELKSDVTAYLEAARRYDPVYESGRLEIDEKRFEKQSLRAEWFPHLTLTAGWNSTKDVFVDTNRFIAGIEGKWNIWDFGRLQAKIRAKDHEIEEMAWQTRIRLMEHEAGIRRIFHDARVLDSKIRMIEALLKERQEIYKNEKTRLIAGQKGAAELVDSFLALEEARIEWTRAVTEYRIRIAELERKTAFQAAEEKG
ncbi:TolC family protein [Omnitrophica bacterium]|nr:TolC family protein [Candidatus Omnitrophota bacterium]